MATEVIIPSLGVIVEQVKILKWSKSEGDKVEQGECLLEIETDKVTMEIPAPTSGILGRALYGEGDQVPVAAIVAVIVEQGEQVPEQYAQAPEPVQPSVQADTVSPPTAAVVRAPEKIKVAAPARKLAEKENVDLSLVTPTGPHGTIMIKDVKAYLEAQEAAKTKRVSRLAVRVAEDLQVPLDAIQGTGVGGRVMKEDVLREAEKTQEKTWEDDAGIEKGPTFGSVIPLTKMRNAISRRMSQSAFTAPHIYLFTEIAVQNLLDLRQSILTEFEQRFGVRPSVNDFVLKAAALTILEHPLFNATLKDDGIHVHPEINVGLAVALEDGLIVPAIPNTDRLGLGAIAQKRSALIEKARQGRLTISEVDIGTFTISSLASSNVHFFSAILNPPQSGILSMGKTREHLHLEEGAVKAKKVIGFGLSVDHRIIDGAMGAGFLETFERKIENPACLLL